MGIFDNIRGGIISFLFPPGDPMIQRVTDIQERRDYREGRHKKQIIPKPGKTDDNIYLNFSGLIIDRSVSALFGNDIVFDLPGEGDETSEDKYIQAVWGANKQQIFLHRMGLLASEDGTGYVKIVPNGMVGEDGNQYARLVLVDPKWVEMRTNSEDFEQVIEYIIRFNTTDAKGDEVARKQTHTLELPAQEGGASYWMIRDYQASKATGGKWQLMQEEVWADATGQPFEFAQILHFQNLPSADDVYGTPDMTDDLIKLQDKMNFVTSNINKIIRLHAHPKNMMYGFGSDNKDVISMDVGELMVAQIPEAWWKTLELQSDLASSQQFLLTLRQAFFDISRTIDIDSIADKLGALTNFGLKVLYQDALAKIHTKQKLYGDALCELNRRLLIIGGFTNTDPGVVVWPEVLPVNGLEESTELEKDMDIGILSKQTASGIKGRDWKEEQKRIADEQVQQGNVGETILRGFLGGR